MTAQEQHKADLFFSWLGSVEEHIAYNDKQFYMSLLWQHENPKSGPLSSPQMMYLERMYNKYSMEEIKKKEEFAQNYSDEHRDIAVKCAQYYAGQLTVYYEGIVTKVLDDPANHVLTYNEFNKMCNNKYAKKILSAYDTPNKFSTGDMVQVRSNNRIDIANTNFKGGHSPNRVSTYRVKDKICMVLEVDSKPITRPAKGARIYKVLITDETSPIYAHESDLKKVRRSKK